MFASPRVLLQVAGGIDGTKLQLGDVLVSVDGVLLVVRGQGYQRAGAASPRSAKVRYYLGTAPGMGTGSHSNRASAQGQHEKAETSTSGALTP